MGAWGAGGFQNDTALDWVGDLCQGADAEAVRTALNQVREQRKRPQPSFIRKLLGRRRREPYLEADVAIRALAAAEVVAFWRGHPCPQFPDGLEQWARQHSRSFTPEFVTLARQAVTKVKTTSELKDFWEEGNGIVAPKWHEAIADLEQRLQG